MSTAAAIRTTISSDGVRLAYRLWSTAGKRRRLLVLLHGAASNGTRWSEFVEHTRLGDSWDLLVPDLRGNGASMIRSAQTLTVWSRDLLEILDRESYPDAVLVGHSLGAQIAVHLAHREPGRVRGLVLIDPIFREGLQGKQRRLLQLRWLVRALRGLVQALNAVGIRRRTIPNRDIRKLDEETREKLREAGSFDEIAREYGSLRPILAAMPTANYLGQLIAAVSPLPPLSEIEAPVAVLLSGNTTLADTSVAREQIDQFPNSATITVEANHWPLTEAPVQTREAIEEWLDRTFP